MPHTTGSKSFATLADEEKQKSGVEPNRIDLFLITRKRKDGSFVDEAAAEAAGKLNELLSQRSTNLERPQEVTSSMDEVFAEVMGKEHSGCVRNYGLGPTPTEIWGLSSRHFQSTDDGSIGRDEEVLKLQQELEAMTNKVAALEENATEVSDLEEKVSKMNELEAKVDSLSKLNAQLLKFSAAMQRRFSYAPSMDINSTSIPMGSKQTKNLVGVG